MAPMAGKGEIGDEIPPSRTPSLLEKPVQRVDPARQAIPGPSPRGLSCRTPSHPRKVRLTMSRARTTIDGPRSCRI